MNKNGELWLNMLPCKSSTACTFETDAVSVMVLSAGETGGSIKLCPFPHISLCYLSAYQNSMMFNMRDRYWGICGRHLQRCPVWFPSPPHVWKGTSVQGHITSPYNQQNGMTTQTCGFLTSIMFLHFCIKLHCWASWDLHWDEESLLYKRVLIYSKGGGGHLIMALFSSPSKV